MKDQSWVFIERTDAEAETPILWPPHVKSWLIGKDAGRDWGPGGEGDDREWDGWMHHRLDGHEFGWTPGVGDRQGGLARCNSWGRKELDRTERPNWTELMPSIALNKLETNLGNKLITINDTAIKIFKKPHSFSIKLPNNKNYLKIHLLVFSHSGGMRQKKWKSRIAHYLEMIRN